MERGQRGFKYPGYERDLLVQLLELKQRKSTGNGRRQFGDEPVVGVETTVPVWAAVVSERGGGGVGPACQRAGGCGGG